MAKLKEMAPPTLIAPGQHGADFHDMTDRQRGAIHVVADTGYGGSTACASRAILISRRRCSTSRCDVPHVEDAGPGGRRVLLDGAVGRYRLDASRWRAKRTGSRSFAKGPENVSIALELSPFVQHGHVIEIKGKTEPKARVMVNGQEVPVVAVTARSSSLRRPADGREHHHGDGAERQGRSEHGAEEDRDPVAPAWPKALLAS